VNGEDIAIPRWAAVAVKNNYYYYKEYIAKFPLKRGEEVAQLVEALPYKPEGRGFDSRLCHWNFSLA
jgi:hypothetical protein